MSGASGVPSAELEAARGVASTTVRDSNAVATSLMVGVGSDVVGVVMVKVW